MRSGHSMSEGFVAAGRAILSMPLYLNRARFAALNPENSGFVGNDREGRGVFMDPAARRELETIKQAILDTVKANEMHLFDSYVSGTPNKDSGFDVYVVISCDIMRPIEAM